ncbi:MAG: tyrosine-type recombinase/integrase [Gaiellaceae bacterium]
MASLQARHSRSCPLYPWTPFARSTKRNGCTCTPLYHVVLRHDGKLVREPVGHNRKEAERGLDARRGDVARRTYRIVEDIRFDEWADRWLDGFTGKPNTKRVYGWTIGYAKRAFGNRHVRDLDAGDVRRFLDLVRDEHRERRSRNRPDDAGAPGPVSPATLAKHLRQLGACLQAAIAEGYATENPVRMLHKSARPKVAKSRPVYYTDVELARLWPELAYRPVMLALCKTAVGTGMRFGELAALRWSDVDLLNREVHVSRTFVDGLGEQATKSNEPRTVDLTPPAAAVLEAWYRESGSDEGLVFEREEGGHLAPGYVTPQVLYPALERAGIPRMGERGRKRDFHSFRHTFARIALEGGAEIVWVQRQLGHSSITLTVDTYGHWGRAAEKSQAERLAGAFAL